MKSCGKNKTNTDDSQFVIIEKIKTNSSVTITKSINSYENSMNFGQFPTKMDNLNNHIFNIFNVTSGLTCIYYLNEKVFFPINNV